MTVQGNIGSGTPFAASEGIAQEALARLGEENALLRASLAELRARLEEMEQASERDALTGLPNRPSFMRALDRAVSQANRYGTPAALLYLDVDALEAVNARHGQVAGDAALIHLAKLLQGLVRTSDFAARVGGDEFAMILDHLDHDSAIDTAERLTRCIAAEPVDLGGKSLRIEVAVAATSILAGDKIEDVLSRAERNLALAKSGG